MNTKSKFYIREHKKKWFYNMLQNLGGTKGHRIRSVKALGGS